MCLGRLGPALMLVRFVWILWTGSAAALQSSDYGNVGPVGGWTKVDTLPDLMTCNAKRDGAVDAFLRTHPGAIKRTANLVFEKKALAGDGQMTVHTVTNFLCLPDTIQPPAELGGPAERVGNTPGSQSSGDATEPAPAPPSSATGGK